MKRQEAIKTTSFGFARWGRVWLLVLLTFLTQAAHTQGWQLNFGGQKTDEGWAVLQADDLGFLVVGFGESFGNNNDQDVFVVRTDIDGKVIWTRYYDYGFQEQARALIATADGNYLIAGNIAAETGAAEDIFLIKIDRKGDVIWRTQFGSETEERINGIALDKDGGFIGVGSRKEQADTEDDALVVKFDAEGKALWFKSFGTNRKDVGNAIVPFGQGYAWVGVSKNEQGFDNDIILYRLNATGDQIWNRRLANNFREEGRDLVVTRDGGLAIAGLINDNADAFVVKFDANGNQRWTRAIGDDTVEEEANAIAELPDGSLVITGLKVQDGINVDVLIAKLNADGTIRWERTVGDPNLVEEGRDIQATREGGFVITGYNGQVLTSFNDLILLKTSAEGTAMTNYIRGRVIQDADGQCDADEAEAGLAGWLVKAVSESGLTYYGTSDANGHYSIRVDAGSYQVSVEPANAYWQVCEPNGVSLRLDAVYDTTTVDFPVTTGIVCPYLEIDVSTPFLASCNEINYLVSYSNLGTETANNAYVEVQLDAELGFQQASLPATDLGNGRYRIALGNIAPGTGSVFQLNTTLPCDGIAEQQAIRVSARIFPDTSCLQPSAQWDGSSVRVSANCVQQDTVEFTIQNIGQQRMLMPRRSIVIVDDVVLRYLDRSYQLGTQEETRVRIPTNGATFRLVAEQATGHPGRSTPTVAVEGCVENGQAFTTGYVTQFPENDQDPFISIDVQEAGTAPASPVFLRGYPKGYRDSIVSAQTDLTYTILFANTGEDTVRRVVIRDTLSSALDLAQLEPGAASHPYRLEVYDQGYIRITFDDINLVPAAGDGNPKNYAFVEFRISQKPDNPAGTVIDNRAMVFFDYEVPALTNQTRHRVDVFPDFVEVVTSTKEIFVPGVNVQIYPNPFSESVRFQVEGGNFQLLRLSVYDLNGRLVSQQQSPNGQELMFFRGTLPTGSYIYRLESGRQLINSGKIIVR